MLGNNVIHHANLLLTCRIFAQSSPQEHHISSVLSQITALSTRWCGISTGSTLRVSACQKKAIQIKSNKLSSSKRYSSGLFSVWLWTAWVSEMTQHRAISASHKPHSTDHMGDAKKIPSAKCLLEEAHLRIYMHLSHAVWHSCIWWHAAAAQELHSLLAERLQGKNWMLWSRALSRGCWGEGEEYHSKSQLDRDSSFTCDDDETLKFSVVHFFVTSHCASFKEALIICCKYAGGGWLLKLII